MRNNMSHSSFDNYYNNNNSGDNRSFKFTTSGINATYVTETTKHTVTFQMTSVVFTKNWFVPLQLLQAI